MAVERDGRGGTTPLPRRYGEIVRAAREVFLAEGYSAASVDRIAEAASVSKQSVYGAFGDKRELFVAVLSATVDEAGDAVAGRLASLPASGSVAGDLLELARGQLRLVMTPEMMRLRRTVIGEAERFPELAVMFYERGAGRTIEAMRELFGRLAAEEDLSIDDPVVAARRFNWLVMSEPVNRAMLLGLPDPPIAAKIEQWAAEAVEAFLAIYPPRRPDGSGTPANEQERPGREVK